MDEVLAALAALGTTGRRAALASLVWSSGSIPMSDRAKMLVGEDGTVMGTIGGGCLEAEILTLAGQVIRTQRPELSRFTLTEEQAGEGGLNCGGSLRILTEPVARQEVFTALHRARLERRSCALVGLLVPGQTQVPRMLVAPGQDPLGVLGTPELDQWAAAQAEAVLALDQGESQLQALAPALGGATGAELFIEPYLPSPLLYIFGGGHVGGQVCRLAAQVGFEVVMVDDRAQFSNPRRHPAAHRCVVAPFDQVFTQLPIDNRSYLIAATRGHEHDEVVVEQAIRTPAQYVGMLGSERKKLLMWERLAGRGADRGRLEAVYAPVGLNIGADTPEEIAVSVVAELVRVRRGRVKQWKTKKADSGGQL